MNNPLPPPTDEEIAAFEADTARLRTSLMRDDSAADMRSDTPNITLSEVRRPSKPVAKTPPRARAAQAATPAPEPETPSPALLAAQISEVQAKADALRRQPKFRIANGLMAMLDATFIQTRAQNPDEPMTRGNADRAIEGTILCGLTRMMTGDGGSDAIEDQAAEAVSLILHALRQSGMPLETMMEVITMGRDNFGIDVRNEESQKVNEVQSRFAPAWAWAIIDETLQMDAQSRAFDHKLRDTIGNAFTAMQVATENTELQTLAVDDLVGEPGFNETEGDTSADDEEGNAE